MPLSESVSAAAVPLSERVSAALAAAGTPPRARDDPPPWLFPAQRESFARALAALRRHGTACIADPVGSGKTYVALAVAAAWSSTSPVVCLVPAVLIEQWSGVAARLSVPVQLHSHERVSRGQLPGQQAAVADGALVVIDESHRFREPTTRRYRTLAPWLVGKRPLLLTGTPLVNRAYDLLHQLRLGAADDTLAPYGVPSLAELLVTGRGHPALGRLVVVGQSQAAGAPRPTRAGCRELADDPEIQGIAARLDALRLSAAPDVATLVRVGLLRALASSPAAFSEALSRYRGLLLHAADAAAAGRPVTRRDLRHAVGADDTQLVFWALLEASTDGAVELDPGDLPALDSLQDAAGADRFDPKAARLAEILADRRVSIVFVTHRATVRHLRRLLSGLRVAWCTGTEAGIGTSRVSRRLVLAALDPAAAPPRLPVDVVIATDVVAEGLDLQRAERIVHYDLPWTPTRLRQREGRAVRLGSPHARVEVVLFRPDPAIERRLRMTRTLRLKAALPERLALEQHGADRWPPAEAGAHTEPIVVVVGGTTRAAAARVPPTELVIVAVADGFGGPYDETDSMLLWRRADGAMLEDAPAAIARLAGVPLVEATGERAATLMREAATLLRRLSAHPSRMTRTGARAAPAELIERLTRIARRAARERDELRLALIDRALRFLRRGHTAGEAALVLALARCPEPQLMNRLAQLPPDPPACGEWHPLIVAAVGVR